MKLSTCNSCGESIVWAILPSGKKCPLDAQMHTRLTLTSESFYRDIEEQSSEKIMSAILAVAGFSIKNTWELPNGYWPDSYISLNLNNPWWLFQTQHGLIKIGWRKRVINIDWSGTPYRGSISTDNVTMGDTYIHAGNQTHATQLLTALRVKLDELKELSA